MISETRRLLLLGSISVAACLSVAAIIIGMSYRADVRQTFLRLQDAVSSQARLIEAVARYDLKHKTDRDPATQTLGQIIDAYRSFTGFGETGEFVLARREGDQIVFLYHQQAAEPELLATIGIDTEWAEPMRRALRGESGTVTAKDYRGKIVLAAYEPVEIVNFGLVAKIDRDELRSAYINVAMSSVLIAVLVAALSIAAFMRLSEPIVKQLHQQKRDLEASVEAHTRIATRLGYREQQQRAIALLGERALLGVDLDLLFQQCVQAASDVLGLKYSSILEMHTDGKRLGVRACVGWSSKLIGKFTVSVAGDSMAAYTLRTPDPVSSSDMAAEGRFSRGQPMLDENIQSGICSIIGTVSKPWGILAVNARRKRNFGETDLFFVRSLANLLAAAIGRFRSDADLRQWETLFRHAAWGMAIINADDGVLSAVNPAFATMHGYTMAEALQVPSGRYHQKGVLPMPVKDAPGASDGTFESIRVRKDGSVFPALQNVTTVYDDQGKALYRVANVQDNSERRQLEENRLEIEQQIQSAHRFESLGVLAGGIAHDFNNILMTILGNADLALLDLAPQAPARASIEAIETAAQQAAGLARQMLAYSGKGQFEVQNISINNLVDEITHLFEVSVSKNVVLKYSFDDNLPPIRADVSQISQIMMNLIVNASEAIGSKSGVIQITTGVLECDREYLDSVAPDSRIGIPEALAEGLYTWVQVSDTGCGMDEATLERIFEPFFSTKRTGRGLGMAAMLGIIRAHKGAVKVYSEVGKGSSFKILLPVSQDYTDDWEQQADEPTLTDLLPVGGTILLADDDDSILSLGTRTLQRLGFKSITAGDGLEAVKAFREHVDEIDCVILDLTMPRMNGADAFREIRRISPDAKVILCSGYDEEQVTQEFAGKGLSAFLHKPYTFRDLKLKLRQALG